MEDDRVLWTSTNRQPLPGREQSRENFEPREARLASFSPISEISEEMENLEEKSLVEGSDIPRGSSRGTQTLDWPGTGTISNSS